ncbi:hypothetical protein AAP_04529 [Ascosphaera apis ARSEF 7405]|uniref:Uncharacterized protein n=1 Tax=Ascosphaera apis ARSEF 7405 TaxID=392613 RepID=A0A167WMF6_9EURO|nr:hypothetical protein AAP_04529 [Ascosphaera apis ARSEF 7405]
MSLRQSTSTPQRSQPVRPEAEDTPLFNEQGQHLLQTQQQQQQQQQQYQNEGIAGRYDTRKTAPPLVPSTADNGAITRDEQPQQIQQAQQQQNHTLSSPFFVLVKDVKTQEFHHPAVHYIFSDDEDFIVTDAAVRVAGDVTGGSEDVYAGDTVEEGVDDDGKAGAGDSGPKPPLLPPTPGVKEHYIILDLAPSTSDTISERDQESISAGQTQQHASSTYSQQRPPSTRYHNDLSSRRYNNNNNINNINNIHNESDVRFQVTSAKSLSSTFQILDTRLSIAPTLASDEHSPTTATTSDNPNAEGDERNIMLQIHGTSGITFEERKKSSSKENLMNERDNNKPGALSLNLEDMMAQLKMRMEELNQVVKMAGDEEIVVDNGADGFGRVN